MSEQYVIDKYIWTEDDFDIMGWHGSPIYAVAFPDKEYEIVLDIDYAFKRIIPKEEGKSFEFILAPCTLVFENVNELRIGFGMLDTFEIDEKTRDKKGKLLNYDNVKKHEWRWKISCHRGDIEFFSTGYKQFVRQSPKKANYKSLALEARGGYSFTRGRTDV